MNKPELVAQLAQNHNLSKAEANRILNEVLNTIQNTVAKGETLTFVGFGTFAARKRAARTGRNPQTGDELQIPAHVVPAFKPGKKFKEAVDK